MSRKETMGRHRWGPIGPFAKAWGRWLGWNMGWFMLFFLLVPLGQPQKSGSWVRMAYIIPNNMGLTYYEFYGALWLILFLIGFVVFMRPSK